jgi:hypothetical protein
VAVPLTSPTTATGAAQAQSVMESAARMARLAHAQFKAADKSSVHISAANTYWRA